MPRQAFWLAQESFDEALEAAGYDPDAPLTIESNSPEMDIIVADAMERTQWNPVARTVTGGAIIAGVFRDRRRGLLRRFHHPLS